MVSIQLTSKSQKHQLHYLNVVKYELTERMFKVYILIITRELAKKWNNAKIQNWAKVLNQLSYLDKTSTRIARYIRLFFQKGLTRFYTESRSLSRIVFSSHGRIYVNIFSYSFNYNVNTHTVGYTRNPHSLQSH